MTNTMKISTVLCLVLLISGYASAQKLKENEVPLAVKKTFQQKFAGAKEVKWSKESATEFEAEFDLGGHEQSASFDNSGQWKETEIEIKKYELPQAVQATLAKEFEGYKIEEAEKAESPGPGSYYEVALKNGKVKYEVKLSPEGKVITKVEKNEKAEKKD
jgi:hypothetical protein